MPTDTTSLDVIINALKVADLPADEQEKILLELNALVFRGSVMRMLESMDEPTREQFNTLVESDASEEQLQAFITKHVPNSDQVVADTVASLTSDILAVTSNQ